jgi:hypothetical protein
VPQILRSGAENVTEMLQKFDTKHKISMTGKRQTLDNQLIIKGCIRLSSPFRT